MATNTSTLLETPLVVDLDSHYGLIAVSGLDAAQFLQGQLTCDIRKATPEGPQLGAYCNLKGRVRALFWIFIRENTYYLLLPKTILPNTVIQLKKYALFSKVIIKDVSQDWKYLGMIGKPSAADIKIPDTAVTLTVSRAEDLSHPRHILVIPNSTQITEIPVEKMANIETWKRLDIRAGIPQIWPETVELFLPHDINLPKLGAVSFNKGCYCGQEIIARMEYRAKLKRHLYKAKLINEPTNNAANEHEPIAILPGTKLFTENATDIDAGTVVTAAIDENTTEMLVETLDEYVQNQVPLYIRINEEVRKLEITPSV